jgi:hypothetical protein
VSSGADLFVVCKQCGAEVSPYITECPYCGNRLRKRAPKLPRVGDAGSGGAARQGFGGLLSKPRSSSSSSSPRRRRGSRQVGSGRWAAMRPYATIALVAISCVLWVASRAEPELLAELSVIGPLRGEWWRVLGDQFVYFGGGGGGVYAFVAIVATGLFGWLLERRHGPAVVLALFLGAGVLGALAAEALYVLPLLAGANAGALALVAAWAAPDLLAAREGEHHEGDLLGAGAFAALLLAIPFVRPEASWVAGLIGGVLGLLVGLGLSSMRGERA